MVKLEQVEDFSSGCGYAGTAECSKTKCPSADLSAD